MAESGEKITPAAYLPFKTFMSSVEVLEHGLPRRLDRSVWRSQSGVIQSQIMMALRFFGLVNDSDEPAPALHRLVENRDRRQEHLGALLQHAYKDLMDLDLTKMSPKMLEEEMGRYNVTGDTRKKAIRFFLAAAKFADVPMHPLLLAQTREPNNGARKRQKAKPPKPVVEVEVETPAIGSTLQKPNRRSVRLNSGGTVSIEFTVDFFSVTEEDRRFVLDLIDMVRKYPAAIDEGDQEEVDDK